MVEEQESNFEIHNSAPSGMSPRLRQKLEKLIADEAEQKQRTWSFYEDLRQKNPSAYWKPEIQKQMLNDAADLGDAFRDGGYDD